MDVEGILVYEDLWATIPIYSENDTPSEAMKLKQDQKAKAVIRLMLAQPVKPQLASCKTAKNTWKALETTFSNPAASFVTVNSSVSLTCSHKSTHLLLFVRNWQTKIGLLMTSTRPVLS